MASLDRGSVAIWEVVCEFETCPAGPAVAPARGNLMSPTIRSRRSVAHAQALMAEAESVTPLSSEPDGVGAGPGVAPSNRRIHRRLSSHDFEWLRSARVKYGIDVRLVDVSAGGMAIETRQPLKALSTMVFELAGAASGLLVPARVLRCREVTISGTTLYRSACEFKRPIELARLLTDAQRPGTHPTDFIRFDLALKSLLDQYRKRPTPGRGRSGDSEVDQDIVASLEALLVKASGRRADSAAHDLAELLSSVVAALKQREPIDTVLSILETTLHRTTSLTSLRTAEAPSSPSDCGEGLIYFSDGEPQGTPLRVLNVELPPDCGPTAPAFRLLRAATHLVDLLHEWNRLTDVHVSAESQPATESPSAPIPASGLASWQKVVVRYRDGRVLRGYTTDFNVTRSQLHLSSVPCSGDSLIVPLTQLKALFFVRDFSGDPAYVEEKTFAAPAQGRKLEVTFDDGEVLVGSTLSYRPEGYGFFVHPADKKGNNVRIFVASGAVRHVRFLPRG
jgi:hypothetical protein